MARHYSKGMVKTSGNQGYDSEWTEQSGAATVTLAQLTERIGLTADRQADVASFCRSQGPWTQAEAFDLVEAWRENV